MVIELKQENYTKAEVDTLQKKVEKGTKKENELSETNAQTFLTEKGAKIYMTDAAFLTAAGEHPDVKQKTGLAFKTATEKLAEASGIPTTEGERYEDYVKRAIPIIKKPPTDENMVSKNEHEALKSKNVKLDATNTTLTTKLGTYETAEKTTAEEKIMLSGMKKKAFDVPKDYEHLIPGIQKQYFEEVRKLGNFVHEDGKVFLKTGTGENAQTISEISEHIYGKLDTFTGIKFTDAAAPSRQNHQPPGGGPAPGGGGKKLTVGSDEYNTAWDKAEETANTRGVADDRGRWKIRSEEFEIPLPKGMSEKWVSGEETEIAE